MSLVVFWDTASSIVEAWLGSATFAHGFLVLPVCAYLIWSQRRVLATAEPAPNQLGLPLLAGLAFIWFVGKLANVLVIQQLALVFILQALVWTVLGSPVTRAISFPMAYLLFAVPIGESLVPPLQDFTASFAVTALQLSGIPVFLEGRYIEVPSGTWHVAESCSGIRYLIASLAFGCLYAGVMYHSWTRRLLFILSSAMLPILANGTRVYGIILLGHLSDNTIAVGVDHLIYGWVWFGVMMTTLCWLGWKWREGPDRQNTSRSSIARFSPMMGGATRGLATGTRMAVAAAFALAILAVAPLYAQRLSTHVAHSPPLPGDLLEVKVSAPWSLLDRHRTPWTPHFQGADAEGMRTYVNEHKRVSLYIAYYAFQRQGAELVNASNYLADRRKWMRIDSSGRDVFVDAKRVRAEQTILRSHAGTYLLWSWYWVADELTGSPLYAKYLEAKSQLFSTPQSAAVIVVGTKYKDTSPDAAVTLQEFLRCVRLGASLRAFRDT